MRIGTPNLSGGGTIYGALAITGSLTLSSNAQAFRLYNTYTDALNYERFGITWASNIVTLGGAVAGTGTARPLRLTSDGVTTLYIEDAVNAPGSASVAVERSGTSGTTQFAVGGRGSGLTSVAILHTRLMPIINQASGTYTILDINPTETLIGAGPHYLIRGRLGAGSDVFQVKNDGAIVSGNASNGVQFKNSGGTSAVFTRSDGTTPAGLVALSVRVSQVTVTNLGTASGAGAGSLAYATDLTSMTRGTTATGGGSLKGLVQSDGTSWLVV